ncbi:hypothetical protein K0M31_010656 [Melipona bicolor]|uniref:Uncharacterized protein n=1 Tax=Melipona bicolor TaxID=60889 RepID=A0AA40FMG4_9HYME|nr:hypothetical protein K0M31_010656 [Melipona bicolor]
MKKCSGRFDQRTMTVKAGKKFPRRRHRRTFPSSRLCRTRYYRTVEEEEEKEEEEEEEEEEKEESREQARGG